LVRAAKGRLAVVGEGEAQLPNACDLCPCALRLRLQQLRPNQMLSGLRPRFRASQLARLRLLISKPERVQLVLLPPEPGQAAVGVSERELVPQ
jgi:hypothetical protein